jgi:hypothetical protein
MDDAQVPADGEEKGEARRPGRRLSDAETVAATRRDMFGDGSLLDTLAGSPAALQNPEDVPAAPPADPADTPVPDATSVEGHGDPGGVDPFPPGQLASFPQSLDDIIDSFPTEPSARETDGPDTRGASSGFLPPPRLTAMDHGLGTGGLASDPPLAAPPGRMDVSAIFNTLGPLEAHDGETHLRAEAVLSPGDEGAAGPPQAAPDQEDGSHGDTETGTSAQVLTLADAPVLQPLMLPPMPQIPGPPHPESEGMPPLSDADMPQFAEPLRRGGIPPFSEPPAYPEDAVGEEAYPGPEGPEGMPQFAAPLKIGGAAPFADPPTFSDDEVYAADPATEGFSEPATEVSDAPPYAEPPELPPTTTTLEVQEPPEVAPPSPPPLLHATVGTDAEAAAAPMFDAAAKIAAEASATAEALDNLNRLLTQNVPDADATQPRPLRRGPAQMHFHPDPAPYAPSPPAPIVPFPVPREHGRGRSIYLLGFLTGLGLSLMAGIALYVLINTG